MLAPSHLVCRYGWVPSPADVPDSVAGEQLVRMLVDLNITLNFPSLTLHHSRLHDDTRSEQYAWVHGTSVTHMEILCGAMRDRNPNALFFLRDDDHVSNIPPEFLPQFVEPRYASGVALQSLKAKVRACLTCIYGGVG
jgi:hypothetical protein